VSHRTEGKIIARGRASTLLAPGIGVVAEVVPAMQRPRALLLEKEPFDDPEWVFDCLRTA